MRQYRMITPTFDPLLAFFDLPWPRFTREWGGNQSLLNRYIDGDFGSCSRVTAVLVRGLLLFSFVGCYHGPCSWVTVDLVRVYYWFLFMGYYGSCSSGNLCSIPVYW